MSTSECPFTLSASANANANTANHFGVATKFWSISWNIVADASVRGRAEVVLTLLAQCKRPLSIKSQSREWEFFTGASLE